MFYETELAQPEICDGPAKAASPRTRTASPGSSVADVWERPGTFSVPEQPHCDDESSSNLIFIPPNGLSDVAV